MEVIDKNTGEEDSEWPESYSPPGHSSTVFMICCTEFTPKMRFFVKDDEEMESKP
ncbi:MAG TPA: hypothetical protein VFG29_05695 [Syntrophales bacterium]|nr:hypothetical protein [Syntrophales bacterium]